MLVHLLWALKSVYSRELPRPAAHHAPPFDRDTVYHRVCQLNRGWDHNICVSIEYYGRITCFDFYGGKLWRQILYSSLFSGHLCSRLIFLFW